MAKGGGFDEGLGIPPRHGKDAGEAGSRIVAAALRAQFDRLVPAFASLESDTPIEDVHASRVAARRLRSLLKTFRPLLDTRRARLCRVDLRSFAHALDGVREADVRAQLLSELAAGLAAPGSADLQLLVAELGELRRDARAALRARIAQPEWAALRKAIAAHAADRVLTSVAPASLSSVIELARVPWRRAQRLARRGLATPAELHELRLSLKHFRYAIEPLAGVERQSAERLLKRLRACQDSIGEHRDAELAAQWLERESRSLDREFSRRLTKQLGTLKSLRRRQARARVAKLKPAYDKWQVAVRKLISRAGRSSPPSP